MFELKTVFKKDTFRLMRKCPLMRFQEKKPRDSENDKTNTFRVRFTIVAD